MAEFKEGQGIKTHRDNDVSIKIVDGASGATATSILSIVKEGDTITGGTNDFGIPQMIRKEDGTYCIPAADDNCAQKVVLVDDDDDVLTHGDNVYSAVTASGGTSDFDSVITTGKVVNRIDFYASSPGCFKYEIGLWDGVSTFTVYHRFITQPANPNVCCQSICIPAITGDGTLALRIRATNNDDTDNDAFVSVCYKETA